MLLDHIHITLTLLHISVIMKHKEYITQDNMYFHTFHVCVLTFPPQISLL